MSHKDAPPRTAEQAAFETFWTVRKGSKFCGFGRDKDGNYLAEFARDAFAAWQASVNAQGHANRTVADDVRDFGNGFSVDGKRIDPSRVVIYPPAKPRAVPHGALTGKYAEVLSPFLGMMERELHANSGKGDRPGWLSMTRQMALLEIYYHVSKLQKAAKDNDLAGVREYSADVANMSMMLADVCGVLASAPSLGEPANG